MKKIVLLIFILVANCSFSQNNYLLAETYYNNGEYLKATQVYKKLHTQNPLNINYLSKLIACYQETNNFSEAKKLLEKALKKLPNNGYLNVFLGYNYQRIGKQKLANKNYQLAIKSIEINPNLGRTIGNIFKQYNLLDNAILAYQKTLLTTKNANFNFEIANIYGEKGDYKNMFVYYLNLADQKEDYAELIKRYISRYISEDPNNEANILLKKTLLKNATNNPKNSWNQLLSWLFTQQKEYKKALIQEKALYQRNKNNLETIFTLGIIAFENKNYKNAEESFSFILEKTINLADKIACHVYICKISIATNKKGTEQLFEKLFKDFGINNNTLSLQLEYANYLTFYNNKPNQAKEVLEKALTFSKSKFEKAKIKLKLGDILVFTGNYNKALLYFSQIQTKLKNHKLGQEARFKVAETSYYRGDFSWAKAQLKVLKSATTQLIANNAAELYLLIIDNEPVDTIPSGLKPYAKSELLAYQNKINNAIKILDTVKNTFKGMPIEDEALFKQAQLFLKLNNTKNAIINLENIIKLNPEGILIDNALYELAEIYNHRLQNKEKASKYYQKILFEHPASIFLVDARKKFRQLRGDKL